MCMYNHNDTQHFTNAPTIKYYTKYYEYFDMELAYNVFVLLRAQTVHTSCLANCL